MVIVRLARRGAKKRPFYDVVSTDSRNPRDGRFIEKLGYFNPVARANVTPLKLNVERINYWVKTGAQLSDRVADLLKDYQKQQKTV